MGWLHSLFGRAKPPARLDPMEQERLRRDAGWQDFLAGWPFPHREIAGHSAEDAWREDAAVGAREGFSPLILTPRSAGMGEGHRAHPDTDLIAPDEIVDAYVAKLVYQDWALRQPVDGLIGFYDASPEQVAATVGGHEGYVKGDPYSYCACDFAEARELSGQEITGQASGGALRFQSTDMPSGAGQRFPGLALTRIPTPESWRLPLYVNFGGWNEVPRPAEIAAFAQRWWLRHGAQIACITQDTIEFAVERPPESFEDAKRVAMEHTLFCSEDHGDPSDYIATLRSARSWFFWWD